MPLWERDDSQLIDAVLSGDDSAFAILVEKYEKGIHALVWRKIGDFHYAEEITQDTFLRAYQKLSTLKNKNNFIHWLYVIANRLCLNWLRKQKTCKAITIIGEYTCGRSDAELNMHDTNRNSEKLKQLNNVLRS